MSSHTQQELLAVAASATTAPNEVLTLRLGAEEYGIDILRVQEIRSYEAPTRIAGAPAHLLGVTNLRGVIVPIVDLRCRFGLETVYGSGTVTVVLAVAGRTVGAVVDAVSDVVALTPAQIKPAPEFSGAIDMGSITGIGMVEQGDRPRMLILLDIEQLLADADLAPT
ncbi:chemotaxis protein CheW [Piscinibacter defluvii]|uniref:chemotaxis protein CheW n=1 Tax=Piscinibacter defluvii TaxID=1796922 RepID=UPI000FDE2245|nr:chemotaxis protein CheW [Piscinibacter defluvii]